MDTVTATWMAGPDAGQQTVLIPGPYFVGRAATCELRADDPDLESHHVRLVLGEDGCVDVQPLAGSRPDRGLLVAPATVQFGASLLALNPGTPATEPAHIRRGQVLRTPRPPLPAPARPVEVPGEPAAATRRTTGLLPAGVALAAAAAVALLLHQPMFLIFAAVGASTAVVSWLAQVIAERRAARRLAAAAASAAASFDAAVAAHHHALLERHRAATVTLAEAVRWITGPAVELWQRRAADADCLTVSVGIGPLVVEADLDRPLPPGDLRATHTFADEPVAVDLAPGRCIALRGEPRWTYAVGRSVIVQALAAAGPADLRVVVVTDTPERWRWLRAAPHVALQSGHAVIGAAALPDVLAGLTAAAHQRLVIVTDQPDQLASRTSPLRRAIGTASVPPTLVVLVRARHGVPDVCTAVLEIGQLLRARWTPAVDETFTQPVHACGLSALRAGALVDRLARLDDPDDPLGTDSRLPGDVRFDEVIRRVGVDPASPASIAAGWVAGGADPRLTAPVGVAVDGTVDIDLVTDGPHALVAGTTGAGKSELLRCLVAGWSMLSSPEHLAFVLIDYKGGATFDACAALPHVTAVISDLDDRLAERALRSLRAELRRRESILRHHGATDLAELRAITGTARLPRLVVVVDEFAALVAEQPEFLHALVGVAQRGRSLGIHLVLATQRPRGVISDDIRANTTLRIALRLLDRDDATDVVGDPAPATFPRGVPGRAMLRLSDDEQIVFQTAHGGDGECVERAVGAVIDAADLLGVRPPPPPWQPPLPAVLDPLPSGGLGWIDDPDAQHVEELTWAPGDGSVLVAGRRGMGVTTALRTLTIAGLRPPGRGETPVELMVIDARGGGAWSDIDDHPRCAGVIGLADAERLRRALGITTAAVEANRRGGDEGGDAAMAGGHHAVRHLVVIDGLEVLRAELDHLDTADLARQLDVLLSHGPAAGVTVVAGVERLGALPAAVCATFAHHWIGDLADGHDALAVGLRARDLPADVPGRFVIAGRGLEMQLCRPVAAEFPPGAGRVRRLDRLPDHVERSRLPAPRSTRHGVDLAIGVAFETLAEQWLTVPDGAHVLVVGQPRSGRTTTLRTIAAQWADGTGGWVGWVHGRARSAQPAELLDTMPRHGPRLLLVDDAELVDDASGALGVAVGGRSAGLLVVATGAPEPLRRLYGHWTAAVRASRIGLIGASCTDADGDLLAACLPRRCPLTPRPGLMWLADNGTVSLVQVALGTAPSSAA